MQGWTERYGYCGWTDIAELEKALRGVVRDHHRFLLAQQLAHIDFLDEQIAAVGQDIRKQIEDMSQHGPLRSNSDARQAPGQS